MMIKIFPFIFILLWSSAFITTKPIIDNSDPFAALAFRFALVALGFFLFSIYSKQKILVSKRNFFESFFSGVLFHGFYLGGVFYSISIGMPTAIAALNIHGNTLHSLCHLPPAWIIKSDIRPLIHKTAFKCAKLLIIDEISMVTANLLDGVSATLRKSTGIDKPFGGIPVVLVGDLFQLPPVVSDSVKQLFEQYYDSPRFYSARSLRRNVYYAIELKKTFRQSEQSFVDVLAKIREGLDLNKSVIYLNKNTQITSNPDKGSVWLSPRNIEANKRNLKKLDELSSPETQYEGRIRGKFKSKNLPSPIKLSLKNKAQVMFTKNDIDFEWINGTIGVIEDMTENVISVRLSENDNIVHVRRVEWEEYQYRWDSKAKEIKRDITGTYIQFPLVLAWALTIHKSQGRTIDKVHLDLGYGAFATGQTYVAISRCRKINGLSMTRPLQERDILVDHDTKMFYRQLREKIESLPCLDILQKLLE